MIHVFLDGSRSPEACSKHGTVNNRGILWSDCRCCQRDSDKEDIERERETDFAVCNIMAFLLARWFAAQTISIDIIIVSINYRIDSSDPVLFWTHTTKVYPQEINVFMFRRWPIQAFLSPTIAKFNAWSLLQTSLALSTRVLVAAVSVHRIWEKVGPWATFSWSTLKLYKVCMMYHESRRIMMVLVRDVIMRTQTALYVWEVMNLAADSCVA